MLDEAAPATSVSPGGGVNWPLANTTVVLVGLPSRVNEMTSFAAATPGWMSMTQLPSASTVAFPTETAPLNTSTTWPGFSEVP